MVMKKVRIADLKAHLSTHLKEVRRGHAIVVLDRDTPIAKLIPITLDEEPLVVRPGKGSLFDVPLPPPPPVYIDIVAELLKDRGDR